MNAPTERNDGSYGAALVFMMLVGLITIAAAYVVPMGLKPRASGIMAAIVLIITIIIKVVIDSGLSTEPFDVAKTSVGFTVELFIVFFNLTITLFLGGAQSDTFPGAVDLVRHILPRDMDDPLANAQRALVLLSAASFVLVALAFFSARFSQSRARTGMQAHSTPDSLWERFLLSLRRFGVVLVRSMSVGCGVIGYVLYVCTTMFQGIQG